MTALKYARLQLRLNRVFLLSWILPLLCIPLVFAPSYMTYYPDLESRATLINGMQANLGMRAMYGRLYDPGTLGQLMSWEGAGWLLILSSVMAVLLVFRCYRRPESSSIGEIPRATGIQKLDTAIGTLLVLLFVSAILWLGVTGALLALGSYYDDEMTTSGSISYGAAVALTTLASGVLAASLSVLINNEANVTRVGLMSLAIGFMVRAFADVKNSDAISWLTPLGWFGVVRPYTDDNFWALGVGVGITAVCAGLWLAGEKRRQFATGIVPARDRKARQQRTIPSPWKLRRLLDRGFHTTWALTAFVLSLFFASLSSSMQDLLTEDETTGAIFKQMFNDMDLETAFLAYMADFLGIMLGIAAVAAVLKQHAEERSRHTDLLRAQGVARSLPMKLTAGNALAFVLTAVLSAAAGSVLGTYLVSVKPEVVWKVALTANLSQIAPVLALAGLGALLVGLNARLAWLAWLPVIYSALITIIGKLIKAPDWVLETSAFGHSIYHGETSELAAWLMLLAVGIVGFIAGTILAGRRQIL